MAKMVTRTVVEALVDCKVYDKNTQKITDNMLIAMPEKFSSKELAKKADSLNVIILEVNGIHKNETLYGMTEEDFIKYSTVLPPRGTKAQ